MLSTVKGLTSLGERAFWGLSKHKGIHGALGARSIVQRQLQSKAFNEATLLVGGAGDVAARGIQHARKFPDMTVVIMQVEGTAPPEGVLPQNVKIKTNTKTEKVTNYIIEKFNEIKE